MRRLKKIKKALFKGMKRAIIILKNNKNILGKYYESNEKNQTRIG